MSGGVGAAGDPRARVARWLAARAGTGATYADLVADVRSGAVGPPDAALGVFHEAYHDADRRAVFARARGGGERIGPDDAVAASRIYTPRHIVEFLLQNSLGALWVRMYPESALAADWPYLVPDPPRPGVALRPLRDLRLLDPCCGCGAFLAPAFDMLAAMYAEERTFAADGRIDRGWAVDAAATPRTILESNLHGADLDGAAVAIAAGLLRARAGDTGRPNLSVPPLPLGSLDRRLWAGARFDVVVANPPFVGFRMLDASLKEAVRAGDPDARSDLAVAFQSLCVDLLADGGVCASVTPAAWLTGRDALPLRQRILAGGGPRVAAALGQRVFRQAPLVFVGLSVVERGRDPGALRVVRPDPGSGEGGLRAALAAAMTVEREQVESLPLRPFLPAAPPSVLALARRGPRLGDLFRSFDGIWTGSNTRDTRYWWEVPAGDSGWRALSGGQGHEPWAAPVRLRIRSEHAAGQPLREGAVEYARVAGGRLAARLVTDGSAALAGVVTLVPRGEEGVCRVEEVLAIFNSRIGTAWLRTLSSGLNFNPGYAAEIPLGRDDPPQALRDAVRRVVALRAAVAWRDPTADSFRDVPPPGRDDLDARIADAEGRIDELLVRHLGLSAADFSALPAVIRPRRHVDPVVDHVSAGALRLLGFRWPADDEGDVGAAVRGRWVTAAALAARLVEWLEREGGSLPRWDVREWLERRFVEEHEVRFRRRPVVERRSSPVRFRVPVR